MVFFNTRTYSFHFYFRNATRGSTKIRILQELSITLKSYYIGQTLMVRWKDNLDHIMIY